MSDYELEPVAETTALVRPVTREAAGALQAFGGDQSYALADLSPEAFSGLIVRMKTHDARMREVKESMMEYGVHYGMPGKKASDLKAGEKVGIYKPGVELLLSLYGLVADVQITTHYGDPENATSPAIVVDARALIHRGSLDGPVVAVGVASRNSWEVKYRWRHVGRVCPKCGAAALMLSKFPAKGGPFKGEMPWWCNSRRDGCGAEFAPNDPEITQQVPGKIPNPDAYDLALTLTKMAAKSARADGAITATRSSNLWTQDLEDITPARASEADVDATLGGMYGGNPEDWREAPEAPKPAPEKPKAAAPSKLASDAQKNFVDVLLKRKLGKTGEEAESWLAEEGIPRDTITSAQAKALIDRLNAMTDIPKGVADAKQSGIDKVMQSLKDRLRKTEEAFPGRAVFDIMDGVWFVTGANELATLKLDGRVQLDHLTLEQMMELGLYLKAECDRKGVQ